MKANSKAIQFSPQNKFNTLVPVLITGEGDLIRHHHPQQRAALSNGGHLRSQSESQKPSGLLAKWRASNRSEAGTVIAQYPDVCQEADYGKEGD